jgi:hypothetical protein
VKLACTVLPLEMLHVLLRMNVTPVVVLLPPLKPGCRHADDDTLTIEPFAGALPRAADGVTVMEAPLDRGAVAVKLTVKFTAAVPWIVLVGVTETELTPPVGDPIVKLLDVTDAADAGTAVTAVMVPKEATASTRLPAMNLARLQGLPGDLGDGRGVCI